MQSDLMPVRKPRVTLQRVGREVILHDQQLGKTHVINSSAGRVWEFCDGATSLDGIIARFAQSYNLAPETVQADVIAVLQRFAELQLLEGLPS